MRGSITQRSPGTWRLQWYEGKVKGKHIYHNKTVRVETRREAEKILRDILHKMDEGKYVKPTSETFEEFVPYWLKHIHGTIGQKTEETYESFCRLHFIPYFQGTKLQDINTESIQEYSRYKQETDRPNGKPPLSATTVWQHITCLHTMFQAAVDWPGRISVNPVNGVKKPKKKKRRTDFFTEEELKKVLQYARRTDYYIPAYIAAYSGMRVQEVLALEWSAVDFKRNRINIWQAIESPNGRMNIKGTKNEKNRSVEMTLENMRILRAYKRLQDRQKKILGEAWNTGTCIYENGKAYKGDWVCTTNVGNLMNIETVKKYFPKICKRAEVHRSSFHTLRHSHASFLLNRGVPIIAVKERLGHSSIQVTVDLYGHLMSNAQGLVVNVLSGLAL